MFTMQQQSVMVVNCIVDEGTRVMQARWRQNVRLDTH